MPFWVVEPEKLAINDNAESETADTEAEAGADNQLGFLVTVVVLLH